MRITINSRKGRGKKRNIKNNSDNASTARSQLSRARAWMLLTQDVGFKKQTTSLVAIFWNSPLQALIRITFSNKLLSFCAMVMFSTACQGQCITYIRQSQPVNLTLLHVTRAWV